MAALRKYVLDTNCFVDAARSEPAAAAYEAFVARAAPGLWLSAVVAAELRAGARTARARRVLERQVLGPYLRRGRVLTPSAASWEALGTVLATLATREGLDLKQVPRSFVFDVLIAHNCREAGAVLVSANVRDMERIRRAFSFDHVAPYPDAP
ncbi:MAG TPA: PIN domain-containing protein [Longimicrobium sp.]|jgi:predicted nucleic acid-binding protein